MLALYMVLVAIHLVAVAITGILWTIIDLSPKSSLRSSYRDIRAVHFGSLYIAALLLGLAWAFERLHVPEWHQVFFPAGLGLLVLFSSIGYIFPLPPGVDPFYYWTRGWARFFALIGLVCVVTGVVWTAGVLVWFSVWPIAG